ncbi:MAG TPA: hypothetical protein VGO07_06135 [Candidatus Saccharimonadales bacterium]|nr:hypothetical protein [Candidatus Saccharimonadales bacterium]
MQDIFVRNISANTVVRASVSTAGVGANQYSAAPVISETGRYVVFSSASSNLIDGRTITTGDQQLYMRDMVSNTTTILTEVSSGTFANSPTYASDVSSDGRFVLFRSYATNLGPTMSGGSHYNVFLLDRATNTTTWVNAVASGSTGGDPYDAHMSCDGSLIVFDGSASYLGLPGGSHFDVFLLDRRGGSRLTNITGSANGAAVSPRISCNGNYIGFSSYASNLDPITAGMTLYYHIYNYDRINDQFSLVDQTTGGVLANAPVGIAPTAPLFFSISDKGSSVFGSTATNLDAAATAGQRQLFIRDPNAGTTELLTRDSGGTEGDDESRIASISLDGKTAAYDSYATNLVSGDSNSQRDIFVSATGL